jgi:Tfp pilus assembly protein PilW
MRRARRRNKTGISLVEFSAALVFGLPLIVAMLYAGLEANLLFTIRTNLDVATRRAAQLLITQYEMTGTAAADTSNGNLPSALAFDVLTADGHYFINRSANQFTWTWDLSSSPATLTVTASYPTTRSGAHGLLPFPSPDPLGIGSNFTILTSATFPIPPPS